MWYTTQLFWAGIRFFVQLLYFICMTEDWKVPVDCIYLDLTAPSSSTLYVTMCAFTLFSESWIRRTYKSPNEFVSSNNKHFFHSLLFLISLWLLIHGTHLSSLMSYYFIFGFMVLFYFFTLTLLMSSERFTSLLITLLLLLSLQPQKICTNTHSLSTVFSPFFFFFVIQGIKHCRSVLMNHLLEWHWLGRH